ncbi:MAG TPA: hypothetical protein VEI02_12180 [Planctomycetota bacterium]|nr:hypothetical protein [Planctomycetota bacterium]
MRFLLFVGLLVLTVLLFAHGLFTAEQAEAEYLAHAGPETGAPSTPASYDFNRLLREYPYAEAAVKARRTMIERAAQDAPAALPDAERLKTVARDMVDMARGGVSEKPPFVMPVTAACLGLAGLLLALLMPGTRFRGLALLGVLFGAAAALPGVLAVDDAASLVKSFEPAKHLYARFPHVAEGLLLLAAVTLGARARRRRPDDDDR